MDEDDDGSLSPGSRREWVPEEALDSLVTERTMREEESEEQLARRLLRENAGIAVHSIVHVAIHGTNERSRLDASKYILERVLGRVGDDAFGQPDSPIQSFVDEVIAYAHEQS